MKGFWCHVWELGIEPKGTGEPLRFLCRKEYDRSVNVIASIVKGSCLVTGHDRPGRLGSFLSGVSVGSTLTPHMLAPSHPTRPRSRTQKRRGMAGELWSPTARFRSWLHYWILLTQAGYLSASVSPAVKWG